MVRPLASDSEREAKPTEVHEVDHKRSTLGQGSCVRLTRSEHRRWERRDIKAEIEDHLFCLIEEPVPRTHPPL